MHTKIFGSFWKTVSILNTYLKWAKKNNHILVMPDLEALKKAVNYVNINLELDYIKGKRKFYTNIL